MTATVTRGSSGRRGDPVNGRVSFRGSVGHSPDVAAYSGRVNSRRFAASAATLALLLGAAACGGDSTSTVPSAVSDTGAVAAAGKPSVSPPATAPSSLVVTDLRQGTGAAAQAGDSLVLHYVGVRQRDGKEFDSSWNRGEPFYLTLGAGSVIPGWEQGLVGVKAGARRQLDIPPDLAYGEQGAGPDIGKNEPLTFVIDVLALVPKAAAEAPAPKVEKPATLPTSLTVTDVTVGEGRALEKSDYAVLHYVGVLSRNGTEFDSSYSRKQPFGTQVGVGNLIKGWDEGLIGIKPGGVRRLDIPADLAYGATGSRSGSIGPNEPLTFLVTALAVVDPS